jgi:hypothetical protein
VLKAFARNAGQRGERTHRPTGSGEYAASVSFSRTEHWLIVARAEGSAGSTPIVGLPGRSGCLSSGWRADRSHPG